MKRILAALLLAALLLPLMAGCNRENGEKEILGQLDRFEEDDEGAEWAVISISEPPYSVNFPANEEINSEMSGPGTWITVVLDSESNVCDMRIAVLA